MLSAWYSNLSLSGKLLVPLLSVTLATWGVGSVTVSTVLNRQIEQNLEESTAEVASLVKQNFVQRDQILHLKTRSVSETGVVGAAIAQQNKSKLLQQLLPLRTSVNLDLIKTVDVQGEPIVDLRSGKLQDVGLQDRRISKAGATGLNLTAVIHASTSDEAALVKVMAVKNSQGIVGALLFGTSVDDTLLNELRANAQQQLIFIKEDRVIAATLPELKEIDFEYSLTADNLEIELEKERFSAVEIDLSDIIESNDRLVLLQPLTEVTKTKRRLWLMTTAFSLLGAGLTSGIGIYATRLVTRRVVKLTKATERLAEGDFSTDLVTWGQDEVSRLADSFNFMADQVNKREQQIKVQVLQLETTLKDLKKAENKLVSQEKEYSRTLEKKVENRTQALSEKNSELEVALSDLQSAQQQMIVQEKLASLGSLTAGIAHEIKNPLNFVNNFSELSVELIEELAEIVDEAKAELTTDQIEDMLEVVELLKSNVSKIEHHGKRADKIVGNMLMHSRSGEVQWSETDINELVAEAVNLAYHGMRAKESAFNLDIDTDYDAQAGKIWACPQDLNRVFLNIISNACYAIFQRQMREGDRFSPVLKIRTRKEADTVTIYIRDNGPGMTPEIKSKVFEQFFTTKPTGEGTGLGLSLSYSIVVDQHHGAIAVDSDPGVYTDFVVTLPINPPHGEAT